MSKERKISDDKVQEIVNQYRESFRADLQQGKFNHRSLEKHLNDVMNRLSEEMRKEACDLLGEAGENIKKKTALAPVAEEKFESTSKEPKSKY